MIKISENISLKKLNTFGIEANAKWFAEAKTVEDLKEIVSNNSITGNGILIVGGGSNLLFTKDFGGLVIKNSLRGINIVEETEDHVLVKAMAGEVWHDFVQWCISKGYSGLENLSLIPGCVGASPMQNIGAYGVEIKDVFESLEALPFKDGSIRKFNRADCKFGYRESVFKNELKNQFIITSVTFRLSKNATLNTSYGAINDELKNMGIMNPGIKDVSNAVINIRKSKLPDPSVTGNAGSFFKNPEVSKEECERIKQQFPALVAYQLDNGNFKLAAGWLIENAGLKGYEKGNAAVHSKQALVLINKGNATGNEIYSLSEYVLQTVFAKFGVKLEREVNII